eukprot:TRINITY_DN41697_c0_g1_i1.p1 TRINITY_DN41697_c0_g1~~TRINITY_DN41697_c0_g1_i1.p1  ORF type:complete len:913 (-),score=246.10 TRINITY_DN41697_c0_g1_i1:163-2901(-)
MFGNVLDHRLSLLASKLEGLQEALGRKADLDAVPSKAEVAMLAEKLKEMPSRKQVRRLEHALQGKADLTEVPSAEQFLSLVDTVELKADASDVPSKSGLATAAAMLMQKADACNVPTKQDLRALQEALEKKADACEVATKREMQSALESALLAKADVTEVPSKQDVQSALESALLTKAQLSEMPDNKRLDALDASLQEKVRELQLQLQTLSAALDSKADSSQAVQPSDLESCKADFRKIADAAAVPIFEELQSISKTIQLMKSDALKAPSWATVQELTDTLRLKANASEVASLELLESVRGAVSLKADASSVPTYAQLNTIIADVQSKANANEVSASAQYFTFWEAAQQKGDAASLPRGARIGAVTLPSDKRIEALEAAVREKVDATAMERRFLSVSATVKAEASQAASLVSSDMESRLRAELHKKADASVVMRLVQHGKTDASQVPTLAMVNELRDSLRLKANASEVESVKRAVSSKADANSVPSHAQFNSVLTELQRKADVTKVPTLAQLRSAWEAIEQKADAASRDSLEAAVAKLEMSMPSWAETVADIRARLDAVPASASDSCRDGVRQTAEDAALRICKEQLASAEVPSLAMIEELRDSLRLKANLSEVATLELLESVRSTVSHKADASAVPTHAQLNAAIADLQRAFNGTHLLSKQDAGSCDLAEEPSEGSVLEVKEALLRKPNREETVTRAALDEHKAAIKGWLVQHDHAVKATIRSLRESINLKSGFRDVGGQPANKRRRVSLQQGLLEMSQSPSTPAATIEGAGMLTEVSEAPSACAQHSATGHSPSVSDMQKIRASEEAQTVVQGLQAETGATTTRSLSQSPPSGNRPAMAPADFSSSSVMQAHAMAPSTAMAPATAVTKATAVPVQKLPSRSSSQLLQGGGSQLQLLRRGEGGSGSRAMKR